MSYEQEQDAGGSLPDLDQLADSIADSLTADDGAAAPPSPPSSSEEIPDAPEEGAAPASVPIRVGERELTHAELEAIVSAHENRATFEEQAQKQQQELRQAMNWINQQRQQVAKERAEAEQLATQNNAYRQYLTNQGAELGDPVSEFVGRNNSSQSRQDPHTQYMTKEEANRYIQEQLNQTMGQRRQQEVDSSFMGWLESAVDSHPELSSRRAANQDALYTRVSRYFTRNNLNPYQYSDAQIRNVIREQAANLSVEEGKASQQHTLGQVQKQRDAVKDLPPISSTVGTELPRKPSSLTFNAQEAWKSSGHQSDRFFDQMFDDLDKRDKELDRLSERLGR